MATNTEDRTLIRSHFETPGQHVKLRATIIGAIGSLETASGTIWKVQNELHWWRGIPGLGLPLAGLSITAGLQIQSSLMIFPLSPY